MRTVFDIFAQIFRNLWAHKLRSFLTMFGIAWGVGSLLLLVGVGEGFRSGNKREMAEFGRDIMFIFPGRAPAVAGSMNSARSYLLTYQDYLDIRNEAPHVRNACPLLSRTDLHEVSEFASAGVEIVGVEPQLNEISYLPLKDGRWLDPMDDAQRRNVIVLGSELQKTLFPGRPSVGAFVLINGLRFEVIGSTPHLGRGDNTWLNMRGYIPFQVMATYFPIKGDSHQNSISYIEYQPTVTADHLLAQKEVNKIVARNHDFDASDENSFDEWDSIQASKMVGTIFDVMNYVPGRGGHGHAGAGRHRRHQHHAGRSQRAHSRNRIAQGPGRNQPQHPVSFFSRRPAAHTGQRTARHGHGRRPNGNDGRVSGTGRIRSAKTRAHVRFAGHWQPDSGRSSRRPLSRAQSRHAATRGSAAAGVIATAENAIRLKRQQ